MYLCIVQNYWGRGETITKAKANAKKEGGSLKRYILFECSDPEVYVDGMGYIVQKAGSTHTEIERHPKSLK